MLSNEKVNCKQHDKAGRRVSGPVCDLAFRDVSISLLARSVRLSAPLSVVKDTRPIRAHTGCKGVVVVVVVVASGGWCDRDGEECMQLN